MIMELVIRIIIGIVVGGLIITLHNIRIDIRVIKNQLRDVNSLLIELKQKQSDDKE